MGLAKSPDIFKEKMGDLFAYLETVKKNIDDLLVLTKGSWKDHLVMLNKVIHRLQKIGLKVNITEYFFGKHKLENIQLLKYTFDAIHKIAEPTNKNNYKVLLALSITIVICGEITRGY